MKEDNVDYFDDFDDYEVNDNDIKSDNYEKNYEEDFSLTDSIRDLMDSPTNDFSSVLGSLGGGFDFKAMLPQIMMGLLGSQGGKGNEISRLISDFSNLGRDYSSDKNFLEHQRNFDEYTKPQGIGHLRGVIPYLEPSLQRHFAIYIKLVELQGVFDYYAKNTLPYVVRDSNWQRDMLLSMRHFSSNSNQYEKFLKMMDMYNLMQSFGGAK